MFILDLASFRNVLLGSSISLCLIFAHAANAASEDEREESELLAAEAMIALNDRRFEQTLEIARKALELDPLNLRAGLLVMRSARELGLRDVSETYAPLVNKARAAHGFNTKIERLLIKLNAFLEAEDFNSILVAASSIPQLSNFTQFGQEARYREIQYLKTFALLKLNRIAEAKTALKGALPNFSQRGHYIFARTLLRTGDFPEAYFYLRNVIRKNHADYNQSLYQNAKELLGLYFGPRLSGSVQLSVTNDNNPFGLPDGITLSSGTPNHSTAAIVAAQIGFTNEMGSRKRWSYSLSMGASQNQSFHKDGRKTLSIRSLSGVASASYRHASVGLLSLGYTYQGAHAPVEAAPAVYDQRSIGEVNLPSLSWTRSWTEALRSQVIYRYGFEKYYTPTDIGEFDRSGERQNISITGSYRTRSHLLYPSIVVEYDKRNTNGSQTASQAALVQLSNRMSFLDRNLEWVPSVSYEIRRYPKFESSRTDRLLRVSGVLVYGLSENWALYSGGTTLFSKSSVEYYNQDRWTAVLGINYSFD